MGNALINYIVKRRAICTSKTKEYIIERESEQNTTRKGKGPVLRTP